MPRALFFGPAAALDRAALRLSVHPTLIVFLRAPRLGAVKRRLARDVGALAAWRFYRQNAARLLREVGGDACWRCVLCVTPPAFAGEGRFWPAHLERLGQVPGDLGRRMAAAVATRPAGPTMLVGGDVPGLGRDQVARAFRCLGRADLVFGPARDGGFWLAGVSPRRGAPGRIATQIFHDVRWSGRHALSDTLANVPAHYSVAMLERLRDVDTGDGLRAVLREHG